MSKEWRVTFLLLIIFAFALKAQDHLLISEIGNGFKKAFVEIHNPTDSIVDLSNVHLTNDTAYYHLSSGTYLPSSASFMAHFPDSTILLPGETKVLAFFATNFESEFGRKPDFELFSSSFDDVPDMIYQGSTLNKFGVPDFAMLFSWDGSSDLVEDIDYITWATGVIKVADKSGKSGANSSQYLSDTPAANQKIYTYTIDMERIGPVEIAESNNGNGITGHDETSEDFANAWTEPGQPSPGIFSASGRGKVTLEQVVYDAASTQQTIVLFFTAPEYFITDGIKIVLPGGHNGILWSKNSADIHLGGNAQNGSENVSVDSDSIIISNADYSSNKVLKIQIDNITTPDTTINLTLETQSREKNDTFIPLTESPVMVISEVVTIAEIQGNFNQWNGKNVTISGIITVGINTLQTGRTNVFLQDQSGRGVNLSSGTTYNQLVRGTQIVATGTVGEYNGVTQIDLESFTVVSTGNDLPAAAVLSTRQAGNFDAYDGTWITTKGLVESISEAGTGSNININDGSGALLIRVWSTTGIDLSEISFGDTLKAYGVLGTYLGSAQMLPSQQEDIEVLKPGIEGDGSGTLSLLSSSTLPTTGPFDIQFKYNAENYNISRLSIYLSSGLTYSVDNVETTPAVTRMVNLSHNGFRLDDADIAANGEMTVVIRDVRVIGSMKVKKYENGVTATEAETKTVPLNQQTPIFVYSTVGGTGSQILPLKNNLPLKVGAGTRTLIGDIQNHFNYYNAKSGVITGRMTISAGALRNDQTSAYVQDESGCGMNVYDNLLDTDLQRGREVAFSGNITDYNGVTEMAYNSATIIDTARFVPVAKIVNTFETSDYNEYEGTYIEIRGIIDDQAYSIGGGSNILISDPFGSLTARVWETSEAFLTTDLYSLNLQDSIIARGAMGVYNGSPQLLPAEGDDIFSKIAPTPPLELKLPAKPFAPDLGEKLKIEYGAGSKEAHIRLRLFDMSGRQIMTLKDETFSSSKRTFYWDGRNHYGELIPVGVYILHLEVVDHDKSNKVSQIAPVVIGTRLK